MNKYPVEVGAIVVSKMGRDEGRSFVVIQEVDSDFVLLADGGLRTMDHLKKKRRKHLKTTGIVVEELRTRLSNGEAVENHEVRSWLKREEK
jgi:ribosomal protein L14E/L6E/L27E